MTRRDKAPSSSFPIDLMRMAWGVIVIIALLITWFALVPTETPELTWGTEVLAADGRAEVNNDNAEGSPQQSVVNGWHSVDLAGIQIDQLEAQHNAMRATTEAETRTGAMILVLGIGLAGELVLRAMGSRQRGLLAGRD